MCDIDKIMNMLDWNNSAEIQQEGIQLAENIHSINVFLQPADSKNNKNVWENCAKILYKRSDNILKPYLIPLLEWLEDINWPGALIILQRLERYVEVRELSFSVNECVKIAIAMDNQQWINNLSELLNNKQLVLNLPKDTLNILQKYYCDKDVYD